MTGEQITTLADRITLTRLQGPDATMEISGADCERIDRLVRQVGDLERIVTENVRAMLGGLSVPRRNIVLKAVQEITRTLHEIGTVESPPVLPDDAA